MKKIKCCMCGKITDKLLCTECEHKFHTKIEEYIDSYPFWIGDKCYILVQNKGVVPEVKEVTFNYDSYVLNIVIDAFRKKDIETALSYFIHSKERFGLCELSNKKSRYNRHLSQVYLTSDECLNKQKQLIKDFMLKRSTDKLFESIKNEVKHCLDNEYYFNTIINNSEFLSTKVYNFFKDIVTQQELKIKEFNKLKTKLIDNKERIDKVNLEDMFLMGQQDMVYNTVKTFLKSKEAITFNIIGINVKVENGYVNAEWKFGNRQEGDIKNE